MTKSQFIHNRILSLLHVTKFDKDSPEYKAIAERNPLDMILYQYIEKLFEEQKEIVDHYYVRDDDSINDFQGDDESVSEVYIQ